MEAITKRILITGSDGFIAKNLICALRNQGCQSLFLCHRKTPEAEWKEYVKECNVMVHLAGINRPAREEGFEENITVTQRLLSLPDVNYAGKKIIFSSSIQAELENAYGISKRRAEETLFAFAARHGMEAVVYRLPNVFGKWCKPEYNSVVATFCHHIARGEEITVHDPNAQVKLGYIDDVVDAVISDIKRPFLAQTVYHEIPEQYFTTVGEIAALLKGFHESRKTLAIPDMANPLQKKLYSTYLSHLPQKDFKYGLKMNEDDRGSFTELLRSNAAGQVSVNITKPGITKGNHWHHTKVEKFLVVSGTASVRFRHLMTGELSEYIVSGDKLEAVDIPVGYTHCIENIGTNDLITVMWANESFDPEHPDTFYEEV